MVQQVHYYVEFEGLPPDEGGWYSSEHILQDPEGPNLIADYKVKHVDISALPSRLFTCQWPLPF